MAQQTRRGYVYVISNIGSFGRDISLLSGEILPQRKLSRTVTLRNISSEVGLIKYIFDVASFVSIRPTTGIKPLYTTIATVTMNLIVSAAIVLLNPYVTVYISYKIPPFALSICFPDVSASTCVEADPKVSHELHSCDKAFGR